MPTQMPFPQTSMSLAFQIPDTGHLLLPMSPDVFFYLGLLFFLHNTHTQVHAQCFAPWEGFLSPLSFKVTPECGYSGAAIHLWLELTH